MRNALRILIAGGLLWIYGLAQAKAIEIPPTPSIYAAAAEDSRVIPREDEPGLLPMRAGDRVQIPVIDLNDRVAVPAASVQAIPTPTAFHAGGALLGMILLSRFLRKLRWA